MTATTLQFAFRSGMSRSKDLWGAIRAKVPVGVVAGELHLLQVHITIPRYLTEGGAVFVDSGAFSEFRTGTRPDFEKVLQVYEDIAEGTLDLGGNLSRLFVVSPDKVGDQEETLRLIEQYRPRLLKLIEAGCNLIVPIQCGQIPAARMLDTVKTLLATSRFVAGIPSNEAAMSVDECATLGHHAFHILGRVQPDERQIARIAALKGGDDNVTVTADAAWLLSRMAKVCSLKNVADEARRAVPWRERVRMPEARTFAVATAILEDDVWARMPSMEEANEDGEDEGEEGERMSA